MFLQPGAGTAQWNQIIEAGRSLTDAQFFGLEIAAWAVVCPPGRQNPGPGGF